MTALQGVSIPTHEERSTPKAHVVYRIDVRATVRSWQVWRRYSEFEDLHIELTKSTGAAPPGELPPKHRFTLHRTLSDPEIIAERKQGLELYMRKIISARDDRWRESFAFKDFLEVPVTKQAGLDGGLITQFTSSSWLDEQVDLQALVRDIRADLNKRDALTDSGDVSGSHSANVHAKKQLAALITRVGALATGLSELSARGMSEGEVQRRTDMAARLQDDCEKLSKMIISAKQFPRAVGTPPSGEAARADRAQLLGSRNPGPAASRPITRVFGAPAEQPQETEVTRPLDDRGLLQLQQLQIDQQDQQLSQLSGILARQKTLGVAISNEIAEQIEILDGLSDDVDRTSGKLASAKKQMNRLG